jgi:hypothetical protein
VLSCSEAVAGHTSASAGFSSNPRSETVRNALANSAFFRGIRGRKEQPDSKMKIAKSQIETSIQFDAKPWRRAANRKEQEERELLSLSSEIDGGGVAAAD